MKGLPRWLHSKESACQCRRCKINPWVRKIPLGGNGNPLQYSCLGNPMDRGVWWATIHGVAKSWTRLSTHAPRNENTGMEHIQGNPGVPSKVSEGISGALKIHASGNPYHLYFQRTSPLTLVAQTVKNLLAVQEIQIWFLGQEDPLEEENGNSLQYSCQENSMDKWTLATVHEVTKSWTWPSD